MDFAAADRCAGSLRRRFTCPRHVTEAGPSPRPDEAMQIGTEDWRSMPLPCVRSSNGGSGGSEVGKV